MTLLLHASLFRLYFFAGYLSCPSCTANASPMGWTTKLVQALKTEKAPPSTNEYTKMGIALTYV